MVIEDDADTLEVITTVLTGVGYQVLTGKDVTAVYAIEKDPPALLLIDNWLSGDKTGHDICYQLKQNPATSLIPVILISGTINLKELPSAAGRTGLFVNHLIPMN